VLGDVKFEARKDFVTVFNNVLRKEKNGKNITVDYIVAHAAILDALVDGLDDQDIAFPCGAILRECLRYEEVGKIILLGPRFYEFFQFVQCPQFDVASDAFLTLKEVLTKHKQLVAGFLENNYVEFFDHYGKLLHSGKKTKRERLREG
jgi:calcium binding protein 39